MRRISLPVTTAAGAADVQTSAAVGLLHAIYADKGTLAATTDITITDAATGHTLLVITDLAANALYMPRSATHTTAGAATASGLDRIPVSGQIRVVVAGASGAQTGTLTFYVAESA